MVISLFIDSYPLPQKFVFQIYVLRSFPAALGEAFYFQWEILGGTYNIDNCVVDGKNACMVNIRSLIYILHRSGKLGRPYVPEAVPTPQKA